MERNRKMRTLIFHGYSDDTFGEYGITNQDCDNCSNGKPIQCVVDCGERGRVLVVGQYSNVSMNNGCWLVGMTKVNEWEELPDWNFRYEKCDCSYSSALLMDLPAGDFNLEWFIGGVKVKDNES